MSRTPKYQLISRDIIKRIQGGTLSEGMRIPSENEIIKSYQVSNTTARKVLQDVELSGWARRIKGKGTFVNQNPVLRSATRILSFTKNIREAGYIPSSKILFQGVIEEGYSEVINGRKYSLRPPVFKLHRLRFADDIPMMLEVRYISLKYCSTIPEKNLTGSLYSIYRQDFGLKLTEVDQMLSTVIINTGIQEFLNVPENTPGMRVDGITFCGKERILEMECSIYRGDKYRFAVRAT